MLEASSASRYFKTNYLASEAPETRRSRDGTQLHRSSDGVCATEPMQLHIRSLMNVKQALGEHLQLYAFKAWWIYQKVNEAERCGVTAPPLFLMFKHILRFFCKTKQTGRKVRSRHQEGPTDWMLGLLYEYIWSQGLVPSRAHFTVFGLTETQSFFVILNASQDDFVLLVVNRESLIVIETPKHQPETANIQETLLHKSVQQSQLSNDDDETVITNLQITSTINCKMKHCCK